MMLSVFAVSMPVQAQLPEANPISLACANNTQSVDPAGICQYIITVTNGGTIPTLQQSSVTLSVSGTPDGWNASITPQSMDLDAGASGEAVVIVKAPEQAPAGFEFSLTVTGTSSSANDPIGIIPGSEASISLTATVNAIESFEIPSITGKSVEQNKTTVYSIIIKNLGNTNATFTLSGEVPSGWPLDMGGATVEIPAYSSISKSVKISVPADASEGVYNVKIRCKMLKSGGAFEEKVVTIPTTVLKGSTQQVIVPVEADNPLLLIVPLIPWLALAVFLLVLFYLLIRFLAKKNTTIRIVCDRFRREVVQGGGVIYNVRVENMGKAWADVQISIPKIPSGWQAQADYDSFHLNGGESKDLSITVKPLEAAQIGDEAEIIIIGKIVSTGKTASAMTKTLLVDRFAKKLKVYGITNEPQRPQPKDGVRTEIFVKNEDLADAQATVKLYVNDELRGSKRVSVPAGRSVPAKFFWTCSKIENKLSAVVDEA
ncbi:MAG: NEW3 domain-containing protein [Candidatus Thermoplasmatota archaeon]|nr:NEW3 domain-containing protein [Candidatus Thermoplasmatota archaeon]